MTAQPYRPTTDRDASPATDPDVIVVPEDVVEDDVVDGDAGADLGAANYGIESNGGEDDLTGSSPVQDNVSNDHPAATEPSLVAAAEVGTSGTIDGGRISAAPMTAGPVIASRPAADLGQQWHDIQAMFVDDPSESVGRAAAATNDAVNALVETLRRQQNALSQAGGDSADTEQLRETLRGYRIVCQSLADVGRQLRQLQP